MKSAPPYRTWQRLLALLSVLAVFAGFAPYEASTSRNSASLAPAPLPEFRAAAPAQPVSVQDPGAAAIALPASRPGARDASQQHARAEDGFQPDPRALSGVRQLGGG